LLRREIFSGTVSERGSVKEIRMFFSLAELSFKLSNVFADREFEAEVL
jgi:hypothetical protein